MKGDNFAVTKIDGGWIVQKLVNPSPGILVYVNVEVTSEKDPTPRTVFIRKNAAIELAYALCSSQ